MSTEQPSTPRIVSDKPRSRVVQLDWHVQTGDRTFTSITVARPSTAQVAAFFDRLADAAKNDTNTMLRFPVFYDDAGDPIPDAVMDTLDDDDAVRVMDDITDFLPSRLRRLTTTNEPASTPDAGASTEPTSSP